ncbi:hypothetical protein CK203_107914 [Vitis vinifera]|uniref:RNase H type-1 domain-containing protein n=1 Tax=Vitis vinifera TaxID=29760 RepID=A0A438DD15_VITVI|nr:hypothetical protein CK203_107914 [Vitis vinifera]
MHYSLETALDLGVRQLEIHGDSNLVIQQTQGIWRTRDEKLKPYHAYLDLLVYRFEELRYIHLPRVKNQFADVLATLAFVIEIPAGVTVRPLLIEIKRSPDGLLLLCLDHASTDRVMREIVVSSFRDAQSAKHTMISFPCHIRSCTHIPLAISVWGIDSIGKISPKSSSGHEYTLIAIDYFIKQVETASYARLTTAKVAKFIRSHIIC